MYSSDLTTLANSRLLFNTLAELEAFLDVRSIRSNGIRRCFPSFARLRAAYRDCDAEVKLLTNDYFSLAWLLRNYRLASDFYRRHLARRQNPEKIALTLLALHYGIPSPTTPSPTLAAIFHEMKAAKVDPAILSLLLIKAIPSCHAKAGDVTDIETQFRKTLDFLDRFTAGAGLFDILPVITRAKEETRLSRISLIYHTVGILDTYENYSNPAKIAHTSSLLKNMAVKLDLAGFWSDPDSSDFWKIEASSDPDIFFATHFSHESPRLLRSISFTIRLVREEAINKLCAYALHPEAMKHRVQGIPYTDRDNAWYIADFPESDAPDAFDFTRTMPSACWPYRIRLQRVTDPRERQRLAHKTETFPRIDPFEDCRYEFSPSIYAITQEAVFVFDEKEECFYRLPRHTEHGFETLALDDNVGILTLGSRRYLALDDRLLYIPLSPTSLAPYSITITHSLE